MEVRIINHESRDLLQVHSDMLDISELSFRDPYFVAIDETGSCKPLRPSKALAMPDSSFQAGCIALRT